MNTPQMTREEIVDETVAYYGEDLGRRGVDHGSGHCMYITISGCMCAVGRCLINPSYAQANAKGGVGGLAEHLGVDTLDELLKPQYRGHSVSFWGRVQELHDDESNWIKGGLTEGGEKIRALVLSA